MPGALLGVLGGGQLGRMFVHAAQRAGFGVLVLEPETPCPAGLAADGQLQAPYDDAAALRTMAGRCAAVTTEFENVPASALEALALAGCRVAPAADAVRVCQHRAREKALFMNAGVPCVPHQLIETPVDVATAMAQAGVLLPGVLKTATLGYDGKGQVNVATAVELPAAWASLGHTVCLLERRVALAAELSVIVARGADGQMVHLPVQHNLHREGVLAVTQVPATSDPAAQLHASAALLQQAIAHAERIAECLAYVGVLCVEFFVLQDGSLLANEMAPRPHNSGHYSVDACDISQFDLQLRCLLQWPLAAPRLHSAAVMLNLMGDLWFPNDSQEAVQPDWAALQALPGAHLHLYGKRQARRGRKMGHLTFTSVGLDQARAQAQVAAALLGLPPL